MLFVLELFFQHKKQTEDITPAASLGHLLEAIFREERKRSFLMTKVFGLV